MAFVNNIRVVTENQEELEALRQAVREERLKRPLRPAFEILREIRSKAAKH